MRLYDEQEALEAYIAGNRYAFERMHPDAQRRLYVATVRVQRRLARRAVFWLAVILFAPPVVVVMVRWLSC